MYKRFKRLVYQGIIPLIKIWKQIQWNFYRLINKEINIVVGAGPTKYKGWFSTDIVTLDVTNENHFKKYFKKKKISKILAEHVLEHLTNQELELMTSNFYKYSMKEINIRIAVPDGYNKDKDYFNRVKPGGTGEGAEDHKHLFNYRSLAELFEAKNFTPIFVEYWDEDGNFHQGYSNDENGYVKRSFINDSRNKDGKPNYTSLIIDFKKK